jgi:hypothetical protein
VKSSSRADITALALILVAALLIGWKRAPLAQSFGKVKEGADALLLPGVEQTYVASLGYRSALADLIYGHVLVSYGLHFESKRLFEHVGDYLDVINRLDPKFRAPYWFADTLLTMQPKTPPLAFYRKAREIQERGLKNFPYDQELWSASGQYLAYLAPGRLTDPKEQKEYREAGARNLMHACNLVGSNDNIPYHCVTAAKLLNEQGNLSAVRDFLERLQTMSDDPRIQELAGGYLARVAGEQAQAVAANRQQRFRTKWHADLGLSPRVEAGAVGPGFDPAACAGLQRADAPECVSSWARWGALEDASTAP